MILVTGAAGKTGRAVIRALTIKEETIRALVRRPAQVRPIKELGAQEVVVGDLRDRAALDQATRGIRAIYHICPNISPDEVAIGQIAIGAARSASVEQFVYHSVLHPQTEAMSHHWRKLRVEERLFESGLGYTILQPSAYMQNVLAHWDHILEQGTYPIPYAAETRLGMVDLEDVAAAAAVVLTEPGHIGATYELAGEEILSQTEIAAILSQTLGRPVQAQVIPIETWRRGAAASGLSDDQIETLISMFRYYEHHGFWGNPRVLRWLLCRPPTSFSTFVEQALQEQPA